jgi:hypothetical protein
MSLAPTLVLQHAITAGLGLVSMSGAVPVAFDPAASVFTYPTPATLSVPASTYLPTVVVVQGPYAAPNCEPVTLAGRVPFMRGSLTVSPTLPDAAGVDNDLTPTLGWWDTLLPGVGEARWRGTGGALAPVVLADGGVTIYPLHPQDANIAAVVQGLAPDVQIPASEETSKAPASGLVEVRGLEPTLQTEVTLIAPAAMTMIEWLVAAGHPPTVTLRYGWTTVALSGDAVWTDVVSI